MSETNPEEPGLNDSIAEEEILDPGILNNSVTEGETVDPGILNSSITEEEVLDPGILNSSITEEEVLVPGILNSSIAEVKEEIVDPGPINSSITDEKTVDPSILNSGITEEKNVDPGPLNNSITEEKIVDPVALKSGITEEKIADPVSLKSGITENKNVDPGPLNAIFSHIDQNVGQYIEALREAVSIKSVSAWTESRCEILRMIKWTAEKLKNLGCTTEVRKVGGEENPVPFPVIIQATLGNDRAKKTVLIYGHLDVQPAKMSDGWESDPFVLTERDGKLYGRGATDDKGPVLGWFHAIQAYQRCNIEIPVNIKFIFEAMEEVGSFGLEQVLLAQKKGFLSNVDMVCISDNYWLQKDKPSLTFGLRGQLYMSIEIEMGTKDLHSGVFGGSVPEAMADLIWLMDKLQDGKGHILIPGLLDDVAILTEQETEMYKTIDFDCKAFQKSAGARRLSFPEDQVQTLMHIWRWPSLSLHGIEGAFSDPGTKTVIPHKVIGKFSLRLVPNQKAKVVERLVEKFLTEKWKERDSPNRMEMRVQGSADPWVADTKHPNYQAAIVATEMVYGVKPQLVKEGGSIPVSLVLQELTGKNVLLLPMGDSDDGAHSQNEKMNISNYINGTKVMAAYLYEIGKVKENV